MACDMYDPTADVCGGKACEYPRSTCQRILSENEMRSFVTGARPYYDINKLKKDEWRILEE